MIRAIVMSIFSICLVQLAFGQAPPDTPGIDSVLKAMKDAHWANRSKGLNQATELLATGRLTASDNERLRGGVIGLMVEENALGFPPDGEEPRETEGEEYYADLIGTVADMNDDRTIPALAGSPESIATSGLIKYGDKTMEPVFHELKNPNALVRAGALGTIISFWDGRDNVRLHRRIRQAIQSALNDPIAVARSNAIDEISCLDDRKDFVPILEKLAKTDPENYPGRMDDGVDGDRTYPVRYAARRALREIRANEPCSWRGITIPHGQQ